MHVATKVLLISAAVIIPIGICLILWVKMLREKLSVFEELRKNGVKAEAKITKIKTLRDEDRESTYVYFVFDTMKGQEIKTKKEWKPFQDVPFEIGQRVSVLYLPEQPATCDLEANIKRGTPF